jgi:hypothetical protein
MALGWFSRRCCQWLIQPTEWLRSVVRWCDKGERKKEVGVGMIQHDLI